MKQIILISIIFCLLISYKSTAMQAKTGNDISIYEPVYGDLYISGGNIIINAPVMGDLIIAGGNVTINDSIYEDLLLMAGTSIVNGYVGDDIRCAGGEIRIATDVGGDVIVFGGTVNIDMDADVDGDLIAYAGEMIINGVVKGNLKTLSKKFTLNGKVEDDMECKGESIAINGIVNGNTILIGENILITEGAVFMNRVRYWSNNSSVDFKNSCKSGKPDYDNTLSDHTGLYIGFASGLFVLWYLATVFLMIVIIEYMFEAVFRKAANIDTSNVFKATGIGFLFYIVMPVTIVICFLSLIGIAVGVILLFLFTIIVLLSVIITSLVSVHWLNNRYFSSEWKKWKLIWGAFVIFIVLKVVSYIPVLGFLVISILTCFAAGALLLNTRWFQKITSNLKQ